MKLNTSNTRELILSIQSNPILCLESALDENELSTYIDVRPCIYYSGEKIIKNQFICLVPNKFGDKDLILTGKYKYTNAERTICEMIIFDRRDDLIIEALDDYINNEKRSKEVLLAKAIEYNVLDTLNNYIEEIDDYFEY